MCALSGYLDADERRPSLVAMMDDYWRLMPSYQVLVLGKSVKASSGADNHRLHTSYASGPHDAWRCLGFYAQMNRSVLMQPQNVSPDSLEPQRILFGFFPTYRSSPLKPHWNRVMQVPNKHYLVLQVPHPQGGRRLQPAFP